MNMRDQRVVVIGGTSGIGLAVARAAAAAGARLSVASSRQERVDAAVAQLGGDATGSAVDVLDRASLDAFLRGSGEIDHLVYTAGGALSMMPIAGLDLDGARDFFEVRYFGALNAVHAALPHLATRASITLTSGTAADRPGPGWALGASVCGAMNSFTRAMALELAPVRVNAVAPGVTRSPLWSGMSEADREAMYDDLGGALPVGRVGEVEDAAAAYLYCMTQPYTTGNVLTVDGGALLV
ncbi:SDR family oxidoreductase [Streptomyces sp. NPDC006923]|uniref:SDR family oxidoreductase n=1 Tax=Streptomyces sp. NPDC006923 TaxID=3155355 RepID=UPI003408F5C3